ncbi:MAG: radical SAM protein [Holophaga sp.]|jgi:radical SAM superfamily enzyme YgiQ (UPF0313 family)
MMRVYLINPSNPAVRLTKITGWSKLNRCRVWKPLGLLILARLTPLEWEVEVIDENLGPVDYARMPRPDLVGITAFTSQAPRAYQISTYFRELHVPVVMGGIHASMCPNEALRYVDAVVTGEAELKWPKVLEDVQAGKLESIYEGGLIQVENVPAARHELFAGRYYFGSIQTTRGCPLNCSFCSVTAFNGGKFRHRPVENVIKELRQIKEKIILFVDDNLIGTRRDHISHTKELFRAMIREGLTKPWICQATINFGDDDELLKLAQKAGCMGVFIGFESPTVEGLVAVHKRFNIRQGQSFRNVVERIHRHGILVAGSFIMGIDTDQRGISDITAHACDEYGVDMANVLILTPLPGTALYTDLEQQGRILATNYPEDWKYYTLINPVSKFKNFTWEELMAETNRFNDLFYSYPKILRRVLRVAIHNWRTPRKVLVSLVANLTYQHNQRSNRGIYSSVRRASEREGMFP